MDFEIRGLLTVQKSVKNPTSRYEKVSLFMKFVLLNKRNKDKSTEIFPPLLRKSTVHLQC